MQSKLLTIFKPKPMSIKKQIKKPIKEKQKMFNIEKHEVKYPYPVTTHFNNKRHLKTLEKTLSR